MADQNHTNQNPAASTAAQDWIHKERAPGRVTLTLNRPKANYLNIAMLQQLLDEVSALAFDPQLRVLVVRSATEFFCAGLSPEVMKDETLFQACDLFHRLFRQLLQVNAAVVTVINGHAYGAGAVLACMADLAIAADTARIGHPEIRYGHFTPTAVLLYSRTLPWARAHTLLLSGEPIDAETAQNWGLIQQAVPVQQLDATAGQWVERLMKYSGPALQLTRRAMLRVLFPEHDDTLQELEDLYLVQLASTEDAREGIRAWLERRSPQWKHA